MKLWRVSGWIAVTSHFTLIYGYTFAAIAAIIGASSYFGYKSVSEFKEQVRGSLDAEVHKSRAAFQSTLQKEFQAVPAQIKSEVETKRGEISKTVDEVVGQEVAGLVKRALDPVELRVQKVGQGLEVQALVLAAQANDRRAFEELRRIAAKASTNEITPEMVRMARSTLRAVEIQKKDRLGSYLTISNSMTESLKRQSAEQLRAVILTDPNPENREAAINLFQSKAVAAEAEKIAHIMVQVIERDSDLEVVTAAYRCLYYPPTEDIKFSARFLDFEGARRWWADRKTPSPITPR